MRVWLGHATFTVLITNKIIHKTNLLGDRESLLSVVKLCWIIYKLLVGILFKMKANDRKGM